MHKKFRKFYFSSAQFFYLFVLIFIQGGAVANSEKNESVVSEDAVQLPFGYIGDQIESLIEMSRESPRGELETESAYEARVSYVKDEPLRLIEVGSDENGCYPVRQYDPEKGEWSFHLVSNMGIFSVSCKNHLKGIIPIEQELDHIVRVPMRSNVAKETGKDLRLWLAFRRAASLEKGRIWSPSDFPDPKPEGLFATDISFWLTNKNGSILFKKDLVAAGQDLGPRVIQWQADIEAEEVSLDKLTSQEEPVYAILPNSVLAEQCKTDEGREKYWNSLPELTRRDIGFQAEGSGIPIDQFKQKIIIDACRIAKDGVRERNVKSIPLAGWSEWYCWSSWNDKCESKEVVKAFNGYQICSVSYRISNERGDTRFIITPQNFLPDITNGKRRFTSLLLKMDVRGKGTILDQKSSKLTLKDVLIDMIPEHWPDSARKKLNCILPPQPSERIRPGAPSSTSKPIPARVTKFHSNQGRSFQFSFENIGLVPTKMGYEIFMKDDSGWRYWGHGIQEIMPGTTWLSIGYHNWNVLEWRLRAFHIE